MLSNDISGTKISAELKIPRSTAFERICKLKRRGIIVKETVINWNKLGFRTMALLRISANGDAKQIGVEISKIPNIIFVAKSTGQYNINAIALTRDHAELEKVVKKVNGVKGVNQVVVEIFLNTIYHNSDRSELLDIM